MTLVNRIKKYAKLRGMNLKETALKAGLSQNAIYNWNKHTPTKATLKSVANALDISYALLTGEEEKHEPKKIDLKATMDDDDIIMTFEGQKIPKEDLKIIKRLLRKE